MDKNAIKKYAVWARRELITRVAGQAARFGITEDGWVNVDADSVEGRVLSVTEKKQRAAFINKVRNEGYAQAIEEVAYTWFNRFCALRYMEINGYLPSHIRVFTNDAGDFKPQIIDEALHLDIDGLDMDKVLSFKENANKSEDLFRYLLITQCNALNIILPGMFQKIEDYTELLLPENLLREGSVIERLISEIPEEDWTDQVQIIGWLFQYYNIEPFNTLYDGEKATNKINKDELSYATQLFTPDWIVQYMVENSLGHLWLEGHPNEEMKSNWKYYLDEVDQKPEGNISLEEIQKEYAKLKPDVIRCIDPCCGSGHILCYMFDVLMQIYESSGYTSHEAVYSILLNNLYGLDIDERAAQLAYFAVMMKARSYDKRFFYRNIQPHIYVIRESNDLDQNLVNYFVGNDLTLQKDFGILIHELYDAKEYGSILKLTQVDFAALYTRVEEIKNDINFNVSAVLDQIFPLIQVAQTLTQKYNIVVTNPPYLNANRMNDKLINYITKYYNESKQDLSMVIFQASFRNLLMNNGFISFITPTSWMFSAKFKKIRNIILDNMQFESLINCGTELFDGKVGHLYIGAWVIVNFLPCKFSRYVDLTEFCYSRREEKNKEFFNPRYQGTFNQTDFTMIPDSPIAYSVSQETFKYFKGKTLKNFGTARQGLTTSDNNRFVRNWFEVNYSTIGFNFTNLDEIIKTNVKWFPFLKGGDFQRWYPRNEYVVNFKNNGEEIKRAVMNKYSYLNNPEFVVKNTEWYFHSGITWNDVAGNRFNARYMPYGYIFADASPCFFPYNENKWYLLAYFNSNVFQHFADIICQGLHYSTGQIPKIPLKQIQYHSIDHLAQLSQLCYKLVEEEFKYKENTWDFRCHPLICIDNKSYTLYAAFNLWEKACINRVENLRITEEKINNAFIDIYELQDELSPNVSDDCLSVSYANKQRDIKSLISYAVGCMFGRYSLDVDGLAYAGGEWDASKYQTYMPDYNGILPICDDEYFTDDIVGHFVDFIQTVYGEDSLEENLQFIADALGGNGSAREVIRKYFLNDFYKDHCKTYQKRPIYWLFDSGKKNGFKCLIYLHRYRPDTIARIRTDYVHEQQARYRTAIAELNNRIAGASTSEGIKLNKTLTKLQDQADELIGYEEKIHYLADQFIEIDLDDGVKVNYAKFQDVLAKIK